jgi:threonine/homoserine/homoserine lactone efflux protein
MTINGWDLIQWQWNKTLDDSSFPYLIGVALGIIAIITKKYPPIPLVLTIIAGMVMLFAVWQCLIAGYNTPAEHEFQPPEILKAGAALAFMIPVAYLIGGIILCREWK